MSKIKIEGETKTEKAELEKKVVNLIKGRLIAIKDEIISIKEELRYYTKKYEITHEEFVEKFQNGDLGDDEEFFLWESELNMKNALLREQEELREIV